MDTAKLCSLGATKVMVEQCQRTLKQQRVLSSPTHRFILKTLKQLFRKRSPYWRMIAHISSGETRSKSQRRPSFRRSIYGQKSIACTEGS